MNINDKDIGTLRIVDEELKNQNMDSLQINAYIHFMLEIINS